MGIHFLLLQANSSFLQGLALYVSLPIKLLKEKISASQNQNKFTESITVLRFLLNAMKDMDT